MFKTSAEAITTAAHQCNVRQFQGEPYLLPLTALIIAVKAELGRGKAQSTEPCKPAGTRGVFKEERAVSWPGEASRRQQHFTLLGSAVETRWEQGPIPVSPSRASTALLLGQADSQPCQRRPTCFVVCSHLVDVCVGVTAVTAGAVGWGCFHRGLGEGVCSSRGCFPLSHSAYRLGGNHLWCLG